MFSRFVLLPTIAIMMLSGFLMGANPVKVEKPKTPPIVSVEKPTPQEAACNTAELLIKAFNIQDPNIHMNVITCKVPPAPHDNLGFYVVEIFVKENGKLASYGLLLGDIVLKDGVWGLGGPPAPLVGLDYTKKEKKNETVPGAVNDSPDTRHYEL